MEAASPEKRKRLQPDARRAEILEVARQAFVEKGYSAVSMASIGRDAGVTPGLVNHYFGTKQELYLEVIDRSAGHLSTLIRTDLDDLPREERVSINTNLFLDSIKEDAEDRALLFGARAQGDPRVVKRLEKVPSEFSEDLKPDQVAG